MLVINPRAQGYDGPVNKIFGVAAVLRKPSATAASAVCTAAPEHVTLGLWESGVRRGILPIGFNASGRKEQKGGSSFSRKVPVLVELVQAVRPQSFEV